MTSLLVNDLGNAAICQGRLTLTSGEPIPTSDVTGATTVYFTPYNGNMIGLYSGSAWNMVSFAETSLALGTLTSGLPYDVFAYNNSGTLTLEMLAWTNTTTRATDLALQDGIYVKDGDATRRYLGTFYTTSTNTTEDSETNRLLYNYYNKIQRVLKKVQTATSWTYGVDAVWRYSNNDSTQKVQILAGIADASFNLKAVIEHILQSGNYGGIGIGWDSGNSPYGYVGVGNATGAAGDTLFADIFGIAHLGLNYFAHLEMARAGNQIFASYGGRGLQGFVSI